MTLVIDACSLLNLIHCVGDDSFLKAINAVFPRVYLTNVVESEINSNFNEYAYLYDYQKKDIHELRYSLGLQKYRSEFEKDKNECKVLARSYGIYKKDVFKESSGEFDSLLLSLYLSRSGIKEFNENLNTILFATDDAQAVSIFSSFFFENQIGNIIDSVDILTILYLKNKITRGDLIKNIYNIQRLYLRPMDKLIRNIERMKGKENLSSSIQLHLSMVHKFVYETKLQELAEVLEIPSYRPLFLKFPLIKESILEIKNINRHDKISYFNYRVALIEKDLIWKL